MLCSPVIFTNNRHHVQVRKDHLLLAFDKAESDRMDQERRLAPAAALVSWRLDQSVRDTTAR